MSDEPQVLTAGEAAALLRVSLSTLKKQAAAGQIPGAFKVGGQWRVNHAKLTEYIAGQHV